MSTSGAWNLRQPEAEVGFLRVPQVVGYLSRPAALATAMLVIGLVASLDVALTVAFSTSLPEMEENPVGRLILAVDDTTAVEQSRLALFLGLKCAGTMIVLTFLQVLALRRHRWTVPITYSIAVFQCGLLAYLLMSSGVVKG